MSCCCVQCDRCGFYGGNNESIGCILCMSIDYTMMVICVHLDNDWLTQKKCICVLKLFYVLFYFYPDLPNTGRTMAASSGVKKKVNQSF